MTKKQQLLDETKNATSEAIQRVINQLRARSFKVDELEEAYDEAVIVLTQEQVDAIWAYIRASIALQLRNQSAMAMKGIDYIEAEHIADALESGDI